MEKEKLLIELDKPFSFEGKEYKQVDFAGMDNLTTQDVCDAHNMYLSMGGSAAGVPEFDPSYACVIAHKATGLPVEFFKALPAKEGRKVKNLVTTYFFD